MRKVLTYARKHFKNTHIIATGRCWGYDIWGVGNSHWQPDKYAAYVSVEGQVALQMVIKEFM